MWRIGTARGFIVVFVVFIREIIDYKISPCWFALSFSVRCIAPSCVELAAAHRVLARGLLFVAGIVRKPAVGAAVPHL